VIRLDGIANVAVLGAITAVLWLSPATAADQGPPGATDEHVIVIAECLNPTVADAWFSVDALCKVVQLYVSRQLSPACSSVDDARNGFQTGSTDPLVVFEAERRLNAVQLDLPKLKVELQAKYAKLERLADGSL
jgi:cobalt-zinc-cadmium efflux system outer membrane protein